MAATRTRTGRKPPSVKRRATVVLLSRVFGSGVQAMSFVLLGRLVAPVDFGRVMSVVGVSAVFFVAADLGLTSFISRATARREFERVRTAIRVNFISSVVATVVACVVVLLIDGPTLLGFALALVCFAAGVEKNSNALSSVPLAEGRSLQANMSFLLRRIVALLGFASLYYIAAVPAVLSFALGGAVGSLVGQAAIRSVASRRIGRGSPESAATVLRSSVPFLLGNLSMQLKSIDVSLVALGAGVGSAGFYAAASKITTPFLFIPGALAQVLLPASVAMSVARLRRSIRSLYAATAALTAVAVVLGLFADPLMTRLFGGDYTAAAGPLVFALIGVPFFGLSSTLAAILQGRGQERFVAINGLVFAGLLLAGAYGGSVSGGATAAAATVAVVLIVKCFALGARVQRSQLRARAD